MKINEKKLISILIEIGAGADVGKDIIDRKYIYSLRNNPLVTSLSTLSLIDLIRGLAILENSQNYCFGSTSIIGSLLKILKLRSDVDKQVITDLTNWLLANRVNPYIPFGVNLDLEIKSIKSYEAYLRIKEEHRQKMAENTSIISKEAKKRKNLIREKHKSLATRNNDDRKMIMKKLKRLIPTSRFKYIVESDRPIAFFAEEFSELSGEELNKIPLDLLQEMQVKLKHASRKSAWYVLRKLIKVLLVDNKKSASN